MSEDTNYYHVMMILGNLVWIQNLTQVIKDTCEISRPICAKLLVKCIESFGHFIQKC